ncbi:MAG: TA system VapC family ribonuclease toxin [Acidobacteriota bacterium]
MILVDANILVYARSRGMAAHAPARSWLDERLNGRARIGMPWPSLLGYVRIVTNPRILSRPESIGAAWRQVESWLDVAVVWIPQPGDRHREILATLMPLATQPDLVADAHLAAIAIEHGLTLASTDGDFARFPGLSFRNPLR